VLTVSVERVVAAPLADVFDCLSAASNYTRSPFVLHERLVRRGEDAAYGCGAVRQLTWVFGCTSSRVLDAADAALASGSGGRGSAAS
jgi:hypothetical protein